MRTRLLVPIALCLMKSAGAVFGCPACYGKSDSPMAQGMNAGIFTLLIVIGGVLFGSAAFFVYIARRTSHLAKAELNPKPQ